MRRSTSARPRSNAVRPVGFEAGSSWSCVLRPVRYSLQPEEGRFVGCSQRRSNERRTAADTISEKIRHHRRQKTVRRDEWRGDDDWWWRHADRGHHCRFLQADHTRRQIQLRKVLGGGVPGLSTVPGHMTKSLFIPSLLRSHGFVLVSTLKSFGFNC